MNKPFFTGVCTALVTPFLDDRVNYPMVEQLLRRQMDARIGAVVLAGTTGESPALSDREKIELIQRAKAYTGNQCKIIAGTGSNSTVHTLELSIAAEKAGADALLIVSPYYNKGTPDGIFEHYRTVAAAVDIPIIVYNVPTRTGMDIPLSVYQRLSLTSNIVGIKESTPDITKFTKIRAVCDLPVWSGNDDLICPAMSLGAQGVISVLSNVLPVQTQALALAALAGDFDTAADLQAKLQPLVELLFREVNPVPVKAAMDLIGFDCGSCRLPLTDATEETKEKLRSLLLQLD